MIDIIVNVGKGVNSKGFYTTDVLKWLGVITPCADVSIMMGSSTPDVILSAGGNALKVVQCNHHFTVLGALPSTHPYGCEV